MEALLQVPHRLLTLTLLPGLELCLLCGPRPPLSQLDPQVNSGRVLLSLYYTVCRRSPPFLLHPPWEAPGPALHEPRPPPAPPLGLPSNRLHPSLAPFTLTPSFQSSPHPPSRSPLPSALTGHASCPHLTLVPATTPPTASGPLVAATAGPAASLPVSGTPSAARWLPPAHGHLGVRLGWGEWLDPHPF